MEAPGPEGQSAGQDHRQTRDERHGVKRVQHSKAEPAEEETTALPVAAAAPAAAAGPAEAGAGAPATSDAHHQTRPPLAVALALAAASAAGAALFFFLRRLRRRQGSSGARVQRAAVSKQQVVSAVLALREPSVALPPPAGAALALNGRRLVLSDRLDVHSLETRFGCELWKAGRQPAAATYWPADALLAAGVEGTATVFSEPLGLGPLLSLANAGTPNPAGLGRTHGGGDYGAAVSVAAGIADLALAVDELGSARVPAACCGAYALRTTAGVLPLEGACTASHSLAAPALLAADAQALLKAGQALRLPGGGAPTEVLNYLVAEDFFAACGEEARRMVPAVVAAVKRWAGPDQAQALSLCEWLYHRVASLSAFLADTEQRQQQGEEVAAAAAPAREQRSERVLQALAGAAEALRRWEFVQKYGPWVEARQGELPAEVVQWWQQAQQVDEARYQQAQGVASELQAAMRDALKDGYIFVLPTSPGPAPPTTAAAAGSSSSSGGSSSDEGEEEGEAGTFRQRCLQFAAVAALSGVPQVVLPLPVPGGMPLSVSLLALHKRDLALLQAAAKLGPMLGEEAAALADEQKAAARQGTQQPRWRPAAEAGSGSQAAGSSSSSGGGSAGGQRNGGGAGSKRGGKAAPGSSAGSSSSGQLSAQEQAAAARKEEGNAAFRAGRYEEAVRQYSAAIQLQPQAAVCYSNRAMAYLKLGAYGAAEADCDAALKLELSAKPLLRRGSARLAQGNAAGAKADFRQVLALEPNNRQAREELSRIEALEGPEGEEGLAGDAGMLGAAVQATF